jgi:hypothetical protein
MSKPFIMNVANDLLIELKLSGISPDDAIVFLGQQVIAMQEAEPNYTKKQNNRHMKFNGEYWVMRGFYPGTTTMFKIAMADVTKQFYSSSSSREEFCAKVTHPPISAAGIYRHQDKRTYINKDTWEKMTMDRVNTILVGDDRIETRIAIKQRTPKCMSPKGVKKFNLDLKGSKIDKK